MKKLLLFLILSLFAVPIYASTYLNPYGYNNNWNAGMANGELEGQRVVRMIGYNPTVTVESIIIWQGDRVYSFPTTQASLDVVSTSVWDDPTTIEVGGAGTGIKTVYVSGLNSNWSATFETITLNGTTDVYSTVKFLRINDVYALTWGTGLVAAGDISVKAMTAGNPLLAQVSARSNQSLSAIYSVPTGEAAYIMDFSASLYTNEASSSQISIKSKTATGGYTVLDQMNFVQNGSNLMTKAYSLPIKVDTCNDIVVKVDATSATSTPASCMMNLMLVKTGNRQ